MENDLPVTLSGERALPGDAKRRAPCAFPFEGCTVGHPALCATIARDTTEAR